MDELGVWGWVEMEEGDGEWAMDDRERLVLRREDRVGCCDVGISEGGMRQDGFGGMGRACGRSCSIGQ